LLKPKKGSAISEKTPVLAMKVHTVQNKLDALVTLLSRLESAVIAFSGGADSTLLLKAVHLSGQRALAVTGVSDITPPADIESATAITKAFAFPHCIVETGVMSLVVFTSNPPERCFFCKDAFYRQLSLLAMKEGYRHVLDGCNLDDLSDYRPGRKAAEKHRVRSPLIEAGLSKSEIRGLSRQLGLPTWDRPSSSCLATRFPYGQQITKDGLTRVRKAEEFLQSLGFSPVRIRVHGPVARIEVPQDMFGSLLRPGTRTRVADRLRSFGYTFISLDMEGFRSGSMNRLIR
jgi:uncharacterized protein